MKRRYLLLSIFIGSLLTLSSCNVIQDSVVVGDSNDNSETSTSDINDGTSDIIDSTVGYNNLTYTIMDSQVTIDGVIDNSVTSIEVPVLIEEMYVIEINFGVFEECTNLESITLPFIGKNADDHPNAYLGYIFGASSFSYNMNSIPSSLTTVMITGGLTLEEGAFHNCTGLTSINLNEGITSIKDRAFYGCTGITSIIIPDSVNSIGYGAFENCSYLAAISIPFVGAAFESTLNTHLGYIFGSNNNGNVPSSLTTVTITGGTSLEYSAFGSCPNLTTINIPDSVTSIGSFAFSNCTSLNSITIPNSVISVGGGVFSDCTGLTSVNISEGLTYIGNYMFTGCTGLGSITIPDGITDIREGAFSNCTGLTCITIPESVINVGNYTFNNCPSLAKIYYLGNAASSELIVVGDHNDILSSDILYFYSETEPSEIGNYWHYVDDDIEIW